MSLKKIYRINFLSLKLCFIFLLIFFHSIVPLYFLSLVLFWVLNGVLDPVWNPKSIKEKKIERKSGREENLEE